MARLIDADAPMIKEHFNPRLIKYSDFVKECNWLLEHPPLIHHATNWRMGVQMAVEVAIRLRPADAVEVVHSSWGEGRFNTNGEYEEQCLNCKIFSIAYGGNYCPNCGASMRERSE